MSIKDVIIQEIRNYIEKSLNQANKAEESIKEYSQSDELKQESKYDTRAIEAGYLKDAQTIRKYELEDALNIIKAFKPPLSDEVIIGSLVKIEMDGKVIDYFISPVLSPKEINIEDQVIHIATVNSPLGQGLLNLEEGDDFEISLGGKEKIISLLKVD